MNSFCCQPESSGVFPQFFLSKEKDNPTFRSLSLSGVRCFFGIGTAVLFKGSSFCASAEWSSIKRYLSLDSTLVRAYGFIDVDFDIESSSMKHTRGSFYLFIPEIELDELEGISNLAATLVWDDSSLCTFEEAVQSYELALYQVCMNALSMGGKDLGNDTMEVVSPLNWYFLILQKEISSSCQFSVRLSHTLAIASNMLSIFVICIPFSESDLRKASESLKRVAAAVLAAHD
ncbi:hypothetical protein ACSBR1_005646 [Camellia fascicularis]